MAESRYKLRGNKSKAPVIYTIVIISLMGLSFILYATYNYLSYVYANKIENPNMNDIIASLNTLFTTASFALPITSDVIKEVLMIQVRDIWWLYAGIAMVVFLAITSRNPNDFRDVQYGSSRWANKYEESKFKDNTGIPCGSGFYLTTKQKKGKYHVPNNLNEVVIGSSGAGKSFRKIKPDIIQMTGSYIVTDPSGELYRDMAKFLKKNGYKVRVLNLNDIKLSNTYNPFKYMKNEEDVLKVANMFIANTAEKGEKGDFWSAAAKKLLTVIMLYLFHSNDEIKSFNRIITLLCSIEFENGHISDKCEVAKCIKRHQFENQTETDAVSVLWNSLKTSPPETFGGISETLSTKLQQWTIKAVDILTATDEMDFDDIGVHKTAIFVIQPAADTTYKAIANIFFCQLFARLQYIAELKYNNRLPLLVSFELDEFANIGEIPNFNQELAVIRKYNIRICIVLQGLSQLKSVYDDKIADGIVNNCSTLTFLGTNDKDTIEYISWKLGKTTARVDTRSYNRGGNQGGGTDSESYVARELLTPDEVPKAVQKGENGKAIIFVDTFYPFFVDKFDLASHERYAEIGSDRNSEQEINNANLTKDYTKTYKKREAEYDKMKEKSKQLSDEIKSGKYDEPLTTEEKQEQENRKILLEKFGQNPHQLLNMNNAPHLPDGMNLDDIPEDVAKEVAFDE